MTTRQRVLADFAIRAEPVEEMGDRVLRIKGATGEVARDGGILTPDGWDTAAYRTNPVFLYAHDQSGLPIGRTVDLQHDADGLTFDVEFPPPEVYPFADLVFRLYKSGFLNGASVGFRVMEDRPPSDEEKQRGAKWVSTRHELLELSAVPVGADPNALVTSRSMFRSTDAAMLRSVGLPAFTALAREVEKMTTRVQPKEHEGGIVASVRPRSDFNEDAGFHEAEWDHEGEHTITAIVGVLAEGGEGAVQGIRFGEGWTLDSAEAWCADEANVEALDSWRAAPEDEDEEEAPEDEEAPEEDTNAEGDAEEDSEEEDAEEPEEDEDEEEESMRALVTRLLNVLDRVDKRLADMEAREADGGEEDEEDADEEARAVHDVATSVVGSDESDPYDLLAKARAFAGATR